MNCPNCQTPNPPAARFCQNCGTTIEATMVQGRTVIAKTLAAAPQISESQIKTAVMRAQESFGAGPMAIGANQMTRQMSNQREHTVFVIDKSGSMMNQYDGRFTKLEAAIRANTTMVLNKAQIDPYDEIGIVSFDTRANVLLNLCSICSQKQQIIGTLQAIQIGGGTDINEGLKVARDVFDWRRNGVVRRIVLLTDGHGGHPLQTAEDLKSRGVVIDVIGIGSSPSMVDEKLLRKVASVIEGEIRYRFIKDQQTLVSHYTQLAYKTKTH